MYACLDLGSNSFHLLIAEMNSDEIRIVERFSARVQLGEGIASEGRITSAAMQRGEQCLRWFARHIRRLPVTRLWAVGTNALRQASNAGDFLALAAREGFVIDVITGEEEAALVFAGVAGMLQDAGKKTLVIDIGGGSTELIIADSSQVYCRDSLALGCVSGRERFFGGQTDRLRLVQAVDEAEPAAVAMFSALAVHYQGCGWERVYASSGTAKMLAAICAARGWPAGTISRSCMQSSLAPLMEAVLDSRCALRGLKPARRDVCLPGWAILHALLDAFQIDRLDFSPSALREGMLLGMSGRGPAFAMPAGARIIDVMA